MTDEIVEFLLISANSRIIQKLQNYKSNRASLIAVVHEVKHVLFFYLTREFTADDNCPISANENPFNQYE